MQKSVSGANIIGILAKSTVKYCDEQLTRIFFSFFLLFLPFFFFLVIFAASLKSSSPVSQSSAVQSVLRHLCDSESRADLMRVLPPLQWEYCLFGVCMTELPSTSCRTVEVTQKKAIEKSQWAAIKRFKST